MKTGTQIQINITIATLFVTAKRWKQLKYLSMDKQIMAYMCNGILFSNKKERSIDSCYNRMNLVNIKQNEKRPDTKGHIFYDSTI